MARHAFDRGNELAGGVGLEQVAPCARREDLADQFLALVHREDQNLGLGSRLPDPPRGLQPVELRHGEIKNSHMGTGLHRKLDGLPAVRRLGAYRPAYVLFEQLLEPAPDDLVIVGQQNA